MKFQRIPVENPFVNSSSSTLKFKRYAFFFLLLLLTAVYIPIIHHDFILLDDVSNILTNPLITSGLNLNNIAWVFTHLFDGNWIPLNWISHMLGWQLFGSCAGGHLLINLLIHFVNSLLVGKLMEKITKREHVSIWIAFLFALHPLHMESVTWISERKDVLYGFFFLSSLIAYINYALCHSREGGNPGMDPRQKISGMTNQKYYFLSLLLFALALMSKPMAVTLPFILILITGRQEADGSRQNCLPRNAYCFLPTAYRLLPFFVLSGISMFLTITAHQTEGWLHSAVQIPPLIRIMNAALSLMLYIGKTFWPFHLAIFYPYLPTQSIFIQGSFALVEILLITLLAWRLRKSMPYFLMGWLWYIVMLLPVLGLVSFAGFSHADRFTYLPLIGIFLIVAMGFSDLGQKSARLRKGIWLIALFSIAACTLISSRQIRVWRNTENVFLHALKVTKNNFVAHENLAQVYTAQEKLDLAKRHYEKAAQIYPNPNTLNNLATTYFRLGEKEKARVIYEGLLAKDPKNEMLKNNLELTN